MCPTSHIVTTVGASMLRSLNPHGLVHTSEHRFVRSLPVARKSFIFLGRLRRCPLYYTCRCSCASQDWLSFCSTSTILCLAWLPGGWDLQGRYTVGPRSCQCSGMISPTMHLFLHRPGSSVLASNMYSFAGVTLTRHISRLASSPPAIYSMNASCSLSLGTTYRRRFLVGMTKTIQDKVLEQFSEAIPRIGSSNVVRNLERVFAKLDKMLAGAFRGFVVPCFVI